MRANAGINIANLAAEYRSGNCMYVGIFCLLIYRARFPSDVKLRLLKYVSRNCMLLSREQTQCKTMWMKKMCVCGTNLLPFQPVNIISFT